VDAAALQSRRRIYRECVETMSAYYNEFDPFAAAWLRELIKAGHIADGEVDERSIEDVYPSDLRGFTQCHFFAGIGGWSLALRRAGWSDDRPVWTGSCPCQPFSAAGKGAGFSDERHLWPAFGHLIAERKPSIVLGEQVASKAVEPWIDLVHADLETLGYTFGCVPFPSASVGAPHIRDRAYWVANDNAQQWNGCGEFGARGRFEDSNRCSDSGLDYSSSTGLERHAWHDSATGRQGPGGPIAAPSLSRWLADYNRQQQRPDGQPGRSDANVSCGRQQGASGAGPTNGFWADADWLHCRDERWRPVEPGTFPLVIGVPARVGRLRGYGNAINVEQAKVWIETVMECLP
jgi:DNA (cytosine-5)-methyltransferase 1